MRSPQPAPGPLEELVAGVLGIPVDAVADDLGFRSVPEWDSIRHVELMLALEEHWGLEIDADRVVELTSVRAIRSYGERRPAPAISPAEAPLIHRGLSGVHVDETRISDIDGEVGRLAYRGYAIEDLVEHSTFEETAYLLLHGDLPSARELRAFEDRLRTARTLPSRLHPVIAATADAHPLVTLRTAVSALPPTRDEMETATAIIALVPSILAARFEARAGVAVGPAAGPAASHAEFVLTALTGTAPGDADIRTFDRILILLAEHGANASSFAARVAVGTGADLQAAMTAAIATFAGPLHGGAIEGVAEMVEAIGDPEHAAEHVRGLRSRREPVLGLGHRLYETEDPRAAILREVARELGERRGDPIPFRILEAVRSAMGPYTRFGVDVNVDFYAGAALALLGVPEDALTAAFATARVAGWAAHALEQRRNNVLIRPLLRYVGPDVRPYPSERTQPTD